MDFFMLRNIIAVLIIVAVCNCILSFSENKTIKKIYLVLSTLIALAGVITTSMTRPVLQLHLSEITNKLDQFFDINLTVLWALKKFDNFLKVSFTATLLTIIVISFLIVKNRGNTKSYIIRYFSLLITITMVLNFLISFIYSLGTINKFIDLGSYIGFLSISQILMLHMPIIIKRLIIKNKS